MAWVSVVGLGFDIVGASFLAWGLFATKKTALDLGLPRYAGSTDDENLKMPQVKDRLRQSKNAMIGLPLLILGFILQMIGSWPP